MPNSAIGLLRTKSGLNYTQALRSEMFLSDTRNMLSSLVFDLAEIHIDTSTCFHKAGEASKFDDLTVDGVGEKDEYDTTYLTLSKPEAIGKNAFKKGDIIQLEGKEWLARDRVEIPSGVPVAFTVMEDSDTRVVRVAPGITPGVDIPDGDYLIGAKAKVVPDHCKAFFWWQSALIFKIEPVPAPSTGKYLYKEISAPNADFGPVKNVSLSFLVESHYIFNQKPKEIGEMMGHLYTEGFSFCLGTLILPPRSPRPETYIKTIKNLSTKPQEEKPDEKKPDKERKNAA
ncbi:MAG: hypothetical protein LKM43_05410 [Wolbachia endosymbiont of Penenirmus auritus]|nr:hypothetical protein [Wolbachia endosymbiont of Penenirmus auritus]